MSESERGVGLVVDDMHRFVSVFCQGATYWLLEY